MGRGPAPAFRAGSAPEGAAGAPPAPQPQVGRKVAFVLLANVAGAILGYGTLLVIGRAFDPAAYGSFVFAMGLGGLYALAATLGLGTAHQRLVARGEPEATVLGTAARLRFALMAGIALVLGAAAWALTRWHGPLLTDATTPLVLGGAVAIQVVAMSRQLVVETWGGRQQVSRIESARLLDAFLLVLLLANAGLMLRHLAGQWSPLPALGDFWADALDWTAPPTAESTALLLVACTLVAKLGSTLVAAAWAWRDGLRLGPYDAAIARQLWAFGLPLALTAAIGLIVQYTDVVLLGFFWTAREVGLYGTAQKLSVLAGLVATAASGVLLSRFAQLSAQKDKDAEAQTFERAEHWVLLTVVPVVAGLVALAPQAIHIAVGDRYLEAAPAVQLLALAGLFSAIQVPLAARFMGHGLTKVLVATGTVNAVANAALNLLLVPPALVGWGIVGAAAATAISNFLAYLLLRHRARRDLGEPWLTGRPLRILLAGTLLAAAWWQAALRWPGSMDRVWDLAAWGLAGAILYLLLLVVLRALTRGDLDLLRSAAHPVALLRELRGRHD